MPYLKVFQRSYGVYFPFFELFGFWIGDVGFLKFTDRSKVVFGLCGRLLTEDNYFSACFFYFFFCFFAEDFGLY